MELFETIFDRAKIYEMLFFNVKSVLEYPTLEVLKESDEPMYERWKFISKTKHNFDMDSIIENNNETAGYADFVYSNHAVNYPEYSRVVAITYASLYIDGKDIKRDFKKIANADEGVVLEAFMSALRLISSDGNNSTPSFYPILCGHNIIGNDIPLLIKRYIKLTSGDKTDKQTIPLILKNCLSSKPWDSKIVDTATVWKFNGYKVTPLTAIADYLGLKKTIDLKSNSELSKYFWDNVGDNQKETIEHVALQSATQTNLIIQLMNLIRKY